MKRNAKFRYFSAGILVALIICTLSSPAMAVDGKQITVYPGIKIYIDDQQLVPTDAGGNVVDVFTYNGTTYLPVRAISNVFDIPIQWDGPSQSVYLGKHTGTKPAIWLSDMDYYDRSNNNYFEQDNTLKDNTGDSYTNVIVRDDIYSDCYQSYLTNGQYSSISGTFFQNYSYRSEKSVTELSIYGDGDLLYSAQMQGGTLPISFNVDLTGVLILEVRLTGWDGRGCLGDLGLWT